MKNIHSFGWMVHYNTFKSQNAKKNIRLNKQMYKTNKNQYKAAKEKE